MMTKQALQNFRFQFITHHNSRFDYLGSAKISLAGGCKWIQLRMKDAPESEIESAAIQLKTICSEYGATFIIDDHVEICKKTGVGGVHLGKSDMHPREARRILGDSFIIGGTCNTFEDVLRVYEYVDYIGCGPFRFTTTKENLSPTLGIDGYRELVWRCRESGINVPIVAIGGITNDDIKPILDSGPNGIAMSGHIINSDDPVKEVETIISTIESCY